MVKLLILYVTFSSLFLYLDSDDTYGDFRLIMQAFVLCKGPKTNDCTTATAKIDNETSISLEMSVNENVIPSKGKVMASSTGSSTMRLPFNKPCENLFLKPILKALYNVNNKCEISKGKYKFSLDMQDLMDKYYGGKYFYGTWQFRSFFYNNYCNFICIESKVRFSPRKK